ncbi:MAG: alkaline phosphatase [Oscillospiraceae bacterium]|nr:alkaline phosphatase [Oscillospiraceae bacterium]
MKKTFLSLFLILYSLFSFSEVKYVFYFIGDGMGHNQVLGAEMYRSAIEGQPFGRVQTLMSTFPYSGSASTHSKSSGITDSAAAGTCLASGHKTNNGTLGQDEKGNDVYSIASELKEQGWGVGIMTTVAIDHATPGAFYAHVPKRNKYYKIGEQLTESGFDFFGGAGFHHPQGKKDDKKVNLYDLAQERGYTIVRGYNEAVEMTSLRHDDISKLILVQPGDSGKVHGSNLAYAIDRKPEDLTLRQIVSTAIPFLEARHERFFMMVEGGMIDYACHGDDAATAFGEVWDMNDALQEAYNFYLAHPDETLIVVTADHETGGLALGNGDYTLHLDLLQNQKCSAWILSDLFSQLFKEKKEPTWREVKQIYKEQLGFWRAVKLEPAEKKALKAVYEEAIKGTSKDTKTMYKTINKLGDEGIALLNKKAHIGWTSHGHTAHAVPVFAIGPNAFLFSGWHDNSALVPLLREAILK